MVGYGGKTINTLRLWAAAAPDYFDFSEFSSGDFVGAAGRDAHGRTLTRVLYPDDSTTQGQGLRFVQEYFLVACSLADLVRRFRAANNDWSALPDKVAIQLNDTHPSLAVAGLMRILLDEAQLGWDEAWDLTQRTLAYTNHTLLPEALEKWPVQWFEMLLPRHLEIIYEINRRFLDDVRQRFPGDDGRVRAHEPHRGRRRAGSPHGEPGHRRLAQHQRRGRDPLGAARTHDRAGLRRDVSRALQQQDQRRHAAALAAAGESRAGRGRSPKRSATAGSPTSASCASSSRSPTTRRSATRFRKAKRDAKAQFADWLKIDHAARSVDPDSIFDCQIKRIHEYKRQLLNALHIVDALQPAARESEARRCRRAPSSSPARRRPRTTWPS